MKWALRRYGSEWDYFLFVFGINTGLRVSDMVPLTVGDVRGKTHVVIREKKTNKTKRFMLPVKLQEEIEDYTAHMSDGDTCFQAEKMDRLLLPSLQGACQGGKCAWSGRYRYAYDAKNLWICVLSEKERPSVPSEYF